MDKNQWKKNVVKKKKISKTLEVITKISKTRTDDVPTVISKMPSAISKC